MRRNIRICGIIILIALFLSCMLRISQVIQELPKTFYLKLPYVFVHIDLKGAPPKLDYLQSILKRLKSFGANGLLVEYEDMFPYEGNLANVRARNCYKKIQLKEFLLAAIKSNFQIIPLIPTFGNMEYVLKLKEFQHLCEMPLYCDVICPSHNETKILIRDMLKQVIDFHNSIRPLKYIHIGGSDVYDIKTCSVCRLRNLTKTDLYVSHITSVAEIVQDLYPGMKVLFWDDIIRNQMKAKEWANITLEKGLEPVYLDSRKKFAISHFSLHRYHYKFNNIWIASAFKGADSRIATLPNIQDRFENNFNWMNLIVDYKFDGADQVFIFKGIILTGRSRHSHFDPPCELLPASMPSLILNLLMIQRFKKGLINKKVDARQFYHRYLKNDAEKTFSCSLYTDEPNLKDCVFENMNFLMILDQYEKKQQEFINDFISYNSWKSLQEFYSEREQSVDKRELVNEIDKTKQIKAELNYIENELQSSMSTFYEVDVIKEYINFKFDFMNETLLEAHKVLGIV